MAIIIPSKNIYGDIKNPKVRDNVIERIEVGAVEVVPNNDYETPVYNETFILHQNESKIKGKGDTQVGYHIQGVVGTLASSGSIIYDTYSTISEIKIRKNENNRLVSKLLVGIKESGSSYTQITKTFSNISYRYNVNKSLTFTGVSNENEHFGYFDFDKIIAYNGDKEEFETERNILDLRKLKTSFTWNGTSFDIEISENNDYDISTQTTANIGSDKYTLSSVCNLSIDEPYKTQELEWEEDNEFFTIKNIKVLVARDFYSCANLVTSGAAFNSVYPAEVIQIKQAVKKSEITIYGNTIGIDIVDKTVYINGETKKKVYSVDGNELMQTTNYIDYTAHNKIKLHLKRGQGPAWNGYGILAEPNRELQVNDKLYYNGEIALVADYGNEGYQVGIIVNDGGEFYKKIGDTIDCYVNSSPDIKNQIQDFFGNTANKYANGKETATIRCGMNEYYEYNGFITNADGSISLSQGNIAISTKQTDKNMTFSIGDEVIPMVRTGEGYEKFMSVYNDGTPKVFRVLGVDMVYDGAVWQELTLQEKMREQSS